MQTPQSRPRLSGHTLLTGPAGAHGPWSCLSQPVLSLSHLNICLKGPIVGGLTVVSRWCAVCGTPSLWTGRPSQHPPAPQKAGGAVGIDTSANLNKHLFTPADGQIEFDALMETLMCGVWTRGGNRDLLELDGDPASGTGLSHMTEILQIYLLSPKAG